MPPKPVGTMSPTAKRALIALMAQRLGKLQELLNDLRRADEAKAAGVVQAPPPGNSTPSP